LRVFSVEIKTTTVNKQKQESTGVPAVSRECPNKPASAKPIEAVSRLSFFTLIYSRHCAIVDSLNEPEAA